MQQLRPASRETQAIMDELIRQGILDPPRGSDINEENWSDDEQSDEETSKLFKTFTQQYLAGEPLHYPTAQVPSAQKP